MIWWAEPGGERERESSWDVSGFRGIEKDLRRFYDHFMDRGREIERDLEI